MAGGPIILHDNATPHGTVNVTCFLVRYEWEILEQPPYSPDISPCDFDSFPKIDESIRGIRYSDLDELEAVVVERVKVVERSCLATGIDDLPKR